MHGSGSGLACCCCGSHHAYSMAASCNTAAAYWLDLEGLDACITVFVRDFCMLMAALMQTSQAPLLSTCLSIQVARMLKCAARIFAEVPVMVRPRATCKL